jgi:drug/metabolite transporter (DMT)-like permease
LNIPPLLITPAVAYVAFVFCCFVWGSTFILVERVTHVMGPVEIGLWRFAGGIAVLGGLWWWTQRKYRLTRGDFAKIAAISLLFNAPPQIILPYLLHQGFGHSFFGPMVAPIPLITILVSIPLLGVLPTGRQLAGVLGGLACTWFILDDGFDRGMSFGFVGLALTIPIASAVCNTIIKWKLSNVPAVPLTVTILFVAGMALVPLQLSQPAMNALHLANPAADPTALTWIYLALLGVVGTGLSTAVFVWMIVERGPLFAGMTTYVVPIVSLLWGSLDHERISVQQMAAIAGVLAMVALVQSDSRRGTPVVEPDIRPEPITVPLSAESRVPQPESQVA